MSVPIRPVLRPAAALPALVAVGVLLAALVVSAPSAASGPRWLWPLPDPHPVLRAFEAPSSPYGPGHRGIDIGGSAGTVRAVEDGTVHFAGSVAGRPVLSVRHRDGLLSSYEPVVAQVAAGERVRAGQVIGVLDEAAASHSHCAPELCLHLGARQGGAYLDPELLLGARGPSVLLPLGGASAPSVPRTTGAPPPPADGSPPSRGGLSSSRGDTPPSRLGLPSSASAASSPSPALARMGHESPSVGTSERGGGRARSPGLVGSRLPLRE